MNQIIQPPIIQAYQAALNLKELAKNSDLKDMLNHSANELLKCPSDANYNHALELINILNETDYTQYEITYN